MKGFDEYDDEFELENVSKKNKSNVSHSINSKKNKRIKTILAFEKDYLDFIKSINNDLNHGK